MADALATILQDRAIRRHLVLHDPALLEQARRALSGTVRADAERDHPVPA